MKVIGIREKGSKQAEKTWKAGRPWTERYNIVQIMANQICKGEQLKTNINFDELMVASNPTVKTQQMQLQPSSGNFYHCLICQKLLPLYRTMTCDY
jgi:hypothetical protein